VLIIVIVAQLFSTYKFGTPLGFFFALIISQQNLCYMPIMSLNMPVVITEYMANLLGVATFDPFSNFMSILGYSPQWTNKPPTIKSVEKIAINDRAFLNVLGLVFLFVLVFTIRMLLKFVFGKLKGFQVF
jgi:hypothetical protein